ncbi:hypothetical protein GBA52_028816 [Prunus armeniaca]|nr:hypothetical protein GBA52_028816 [Prunus armeniaca]
MQHSLKKLLDHQSHTWKGDGPGVTFVKAAVTIYEMVQATIVLEDMIKTEYLRNEWWYWSSFCSC